MSCRRGHRGVVVTLSSSKNEAEEKRQEAGKDDEDELEWVFEDERESGFDGRARHPLEDGEHGTLDRGRSDGAVSYRR